MTFSRVHWTTVGLLAAGAFLTLFALVRAGQGAAALASPLTLWALLPYGVLLLSSRWAHSTPRGLILLGVSLLAVGLAAPAYANMVRPSSGSTSALGFVVVPLYQLVVALILLVALFFTRPHRDGLP